VRAVVKRLAARKEELARRAVERFRDEIRPKPKSETGCGRSAGG
jgi:hypothetical protein